LKKTFAALGAAALGLVPVAAAAPALAADTTVDCADMDAQVNATGNLTDNWYQDCVPQYGIGKAEFSIVADESDPTAEFPADFVDLSDNGNPAITVTTTGDTAALNDYFGTTIGGVVQYPITPVDAGLSDPTTQTYVAAVAAPVTSIGLATGANTPADVVTACSVDTAAYTGAWVATFGAVDTTFSQTIDGKNWQYTIVASPAPTYFFIVEGTDGPSTWCVSDGQHTFIPGSGGIPDDAIVQLFALVINSVPSFEDVDGPGLYNLGDFARTVAPIQPAVLAETGLDSSGLILPAAIAGGVVLIGGGLIAAAVVRRRRDRD